MERRLNQVVIETWDEKSHPPPSTVAAEESATASCSSAAATILGVLGAAVLHVTFLGAVIWGSSHPSHRKPWKVADRAPAPLLLLTPLPGNSRDFSLTAISSTAIGDPAIAIDQNALAAPAIVAIEPVDSPTDDESYMRQQQYGIYTGQIIARVERAWVRPRTKVSNSDGLQKSTEFSCRAKILQSELGAVLEVDLLNCNGSTEWQQSLVRAIFSASPLPAPPSPTVFSDALTLTFSAHEFQIDDADDGYALLTSTKAGASIK